MYTHTHTCKHEYCVCTQMLTGTNACTQSHIFTIMPKYTRYTFVYTETHKCTYNIGSHTCAHTGLQAHTEHVAVQPICRLMDSRQWELSAALVAARLGKGGGSWAVGEQSGLKTTGLTGRSPILETLSGSRAWAVYPFCPPVSGGAKARPDCSFCWGVRGTPGRRTQEEKGGSRRGLVWLLQWVGNVLGRGCWEGHSISRSGNRRAAPKVSFRLQTRGPSAQPLPPLSLGVGRFQAPKEVVRQPSGSTAGDPGDVWVGLALGVLVNHAQ